MAMSVENVRALENGRLYFDKGLKGGVGEVKALKQMDPSTSQPAVLVHRFNPLGHQPDRELPADIADGPHHHLLAKLALNARDQTSVELYEVRTVLSQLAEARESVSEIVNCCLEAIGGVPLESAVRASL
jgi:hypothetical protein